MIDSTTIIATDGREINLNVVIPIIEPSYLEGLRHDFILGLSGFLAKEGVPRAVCRAIVEELCAATDDDQLGDRLAAVDSTYAADVVAGISKLKELMPDDDLQKLLDMFEAEHIYEGKDGRPLYRVVRKIELASAKKKFVTERWDGTAYRTGLGSCEKVLYHLPLILEAVEDELPIWLVEGEKAADFLLSQTESDFGAVTTCAFGAGKWLPHYAAQLRGASVVYILPDNDDAGRRHTIKVATSLTAAGIPYKIVELPGLPEHGDVVDWFTRCGGSAQQLSRLSEDTPQSQRVVNPDGAQGDSELEIISGVEYFRAATQEPPQWFWDGLIGTGLVTLLAGIQREGGKSTLVAHLIHTLTLAASKPARLLVVNGTEIREMDYDFVGLPIKATPKRILMVTEEPPWVWTTRPEINWDAVDVISDFGALAEKWEEFVELVAGGKWDFIVLDSLDCLLEGFNVVDENSAAEVNKSMRKLMQLARIHKVAVLVIDHLRKSSEAGNLTEVRGSGAKIGRADVIITLTARESAPNQRVLRAWSRFPLPKVLVGSGLIIEMEDGQYKPLGVKAAVRESEWEAQLAEVVELVPETPTKFGELLAVASMSERSLRRRLDDAVRCGMLEKPTKGYYQRAK